MIIDGLYCQKMSPGLDVWRKECCSSSNRGLRQPDLHQDRSSSRTPYYVEGVPEEREDFQGCFPFDKDDNKVEEREGFQGCLPSDKEDNKVDDTDARDASMAMRNFKFRLVEHLKELLKPHWKEAKISKVAYKVILKNSMTKVIGSFGACAVPQSDQKIDEYLKLSQLKLSKLVQAYVEKYKKPGI